MASEESSPDSTGRNPRLRGAVAARAHLTLALGLALCALAFWFELRRAESGNSLSWAYVFEWPLLGGFAFYMWWKMIHPDETARALTREKKATIAPEFNGMLEAWQEHQRELESSRQETTTEPPAPDLEPRSL